MRNPRRTTGILLIAAGAPFLIAELLEPGGRPLRLAAAGLLMLAGVVPLRRGLP